MELTADDRLSEYICDYIDGTMDPVVEEVFEEYMGQNTSVYNIVQRSRWSKNALNKLPLYSADQNLEQEVGYRIELERQMDELLASEKQQNQNTEDKRQYAGILNTNGDHNYPLWMSLMCVMIMLLAASGYWLW